VLIDEKLTLSLGLDNENQQVNIEYNCRKDQDQVVQDLIYSYCENMHKVTLNLNFSEEIYTRAMVKAMMFKEKIFEQMKVLMQYKKHKMKSVPSNFMLINSKQVSLYYFLEDVDIDKNEVACDIFTKV